MVTSRNASHRSRLVSITGCALGLILLYSCSVLGGNPPRTFEKPPIYPGATPVITNTSELLTFISFETTDSREDVLQYYETILTKEGWDQEFAALYPTPGKPLATPIPEALYFYSGPSAGGEAGYMFYVFTKSGEGGKTKVEIK